MFELVIVLIQDEGLWVGLSDVFLKKFDLLFYLFVLSFFLL